MGARGYAGVVPGKYKEKSPHDWTAMQVEAKEIKTTTTKKTGKIVLEGAVDARVSV